MRNHLLSATNSGVRALSRFLSLLICLTLGSTRGFGGATHSGFTAIKSYPEDSIISSWIEALKVLQPEIDQALKADPTGLDATDISERALDVTNAEPWRTNYLPKIVSEIQSLQETDLLTFVKHYNSMQFWQMDSFATYFVGMPGDPKIYKSDIEASQLTSLLKAQMEEKEGNPAQLDENENAQLKFSLELLDELRSKEFFSLNDAYVASQLIMYWLDFKLIDVSGVKFQPNTLKEFKTKIIGLSKSLYIDSRADPLFFFYPTYLLQQDSVKKQVQIFDDFYLSPLGLMEIPATKSAPLIFDGTIGTYNSFHRHDKVHVDGSFGSARKIRGSLKQFAKHSIGERIDALVCAHNAYHHAHNELDNALSGSFTLEWLKYLRLIFQRELQIDGGWHEPLAKLITAREISPQEELKGFGDYLSLVIQSVRSPKDIYYQPNQIRNSLGSVFNLGGIFIDGPPSLETMENALREMDRISQSCVFTTQL